MSMRTYKTLRGLLRYFERTWLTPYGLKLDTVTPKADGFCTVCVAKSDSAPGSDPVGRVRIVYEGPEHWELSSAIEEIRVIRSQIIQTGRDQAVKPIVRHEWFGHGSGYWLHAYDNIRPPCAAGG
jgi:hypothetical protein